jgi:glycosyltransferase involved in cell wall biosynthesis
MINRPIKVLHVSDKLGVSGSTGDGVAQLLQWWFPLFHQQGVIPELLVLGPSGEVVQKMRDDGISVVNLGMGPYDVRAYFEFKRTVEKYKPDILHAHNWRATAFALWLKRSIAIPVLVHEHVIAPRIPLVQQVADRLLNHRADKVLTVSEAAAKNCRLNRNFPHERVEAMINGIPLAGSAGYTDEQTTAIKLELGIKPDSEVLGFVGRMDEQKGPLYLIEAFSILLRDSPVELFLVMIGDGPLVSQLKELSSELGIEDHVSFLGYRSDVPRLQAAFTLQVMPSVWEGVPLAGLQAMAAGVPLVASNIPGPDEVLENDVNSVLVPPRDSEALAEALGGILSEPQRRARLIEGARESVRSYDVNLNVTRMIEMYAALLDN